MWNKPSEKELASIPEFYSTENVPSKEKIIYMHFFFAGCDWFAAEYSPQERLFFGFVILNNDYQNAEWGYFSLDELCEISVKGVEIDRDLHFEPRKTKGVEKIRVAQGW